MTRQQQIDKAVEQISSGDFEGYLQTKEQLHIDESLDKLFEKLEISRCNKHTE